MKYVLLIYNNPATWEAMEKPEQERVMSIHRELMDKLTRSGELVRVDGLADPINTRTIRRTGRRELVTDGPFSEAKEQLAGIWALDCESIERAVEIATPIAEYDTVEVRPLMDLGGTEM